MQPATVIAWHRKGFKAMWRRRSRPGKSSRPPIPRKHIGYIKRISADHPEWGEDKIAEELAAKFAIEHSTSNPTLPWVKQQIREATSEEVGPRFLVHDNDGIFGQYGRPMTIEHGERVRSYRCHLDRWLDEIMGIEGIPIPYGAPNASPYVERFIRTLRGEALNHFAPRTSADCSEAGGSPRPRRCTRCHLL